eukprot:TRINITY_DN27289_c0_g1_i1.p1 TRINITY_DN27289_c0_g1~~TRINITY_DN27289_c0_g1_i1.p1  ORF type:complete len:145 (+),score=14.20 TRINITY_DN27289_c0_g1_i1:220-654(+)
MRGLRSGLDSLTPRKEKKDPYAGHAIRATSGPQEARQMRSTRMPFGKPEMGGKNAMFEFDPEIKAAFDKNFRFIRRVFSIETIVSPLPSSISRGIVRSVHSFTRIFTQFFDPSGVVGAQKALGLRENDLHRRRQNRGRGVPSSS